MIDEGLEPWLIEVNSNTSLRGSTDEDYQRKYNILYDVLDIVDPLGKISKTEINVGGFDCTHALIKIYENLSTWQFSI